MVATTRTTNLILAIALTLASWTAAAQSASQAAAKPVRATTAGSLSGNPTSHCAALRARYLNSQACFEHYRLANGGLKAQAFKHCKNVTDPSPQCGPDLPTQ